MSKKLDIIVDEIKDAWNKFAPVEFSCGTFICEKQRNRLAPTAHDIVYIRVSLPDGTNVSVTHETLELIIPDIIPFVSIGIVKELLVKLACRHMYGEDKRKTKPQQLKNVEQMIDDACSKSKSNLTFLMFKLQEELGEAARVYNQPERCDEPLEAELVDLILVAKDALHKIKNSKQLTNADIDALYITKLAKWANKAGF